MTPIIDAREQTLYRRVVGSFASGITVVTARASDHLVGMTCQSFVSASLEPPLIAVFLGTDSRTRAAIEEAGKFGVTVLSTSQENLARIFATPGADKFRGVELDYGPNECPLLRGAVAWLECDVRDAYEVGDHRCLIGSVSASGSGTGAEPLVYYRGGYGTFVP